MYRRRRTESSTDAPLLAELSTQSLSPVEMDVGKADKFVLSPIRNSIENMLPAYRNVNYTDSKQTDVTDQTGFDKTYRFNRLYLSHSGRISYYFKSMGRWKKKEWWEFVRGRMPITYWLPQFDWKANLLFDVLGGLMVSVMSVPQSLAYGLLVGVPAKYGLITGIIGPLVYAFLGTSRHASPGSFAIVSLMIGAVVQSSSQMLNSTSLPPVNVDEAVFCCHMNKPEVDGEQAVIVASSVTLLVGLFQIMFGLMHAGLLAVWLSDQLVQGLISGAAVHVLTSQLKSMSGVSKVPPTSEPFEHIKFYICFFAQLGKANLPAVIISLICVVALFVSTTFIDPKLCKKIPLKFPMELILVVASTLTVHFTRNTAWHFDIDVVGQVNGSIEPPRLPAMPNFVEMIGPAISIAIISFVIHISLCKLVAKKNQYVVSSNQEWLALGTMHTVSSFFGCFAGGSSLGRTMMQVKCGTKSQLSTIVCSSVLIIFVYGLSGSIRYLPKPVLAAIVVMAMKDLFIQVYTCSGLRRKNFVDYLIFSITFTSVVVLNVNYGLMIGVVFELLTVVVRSQWADSTLLGRIRGTNHFRRLGLYETAYDIPGIKVFRFDSPLYFANAELFVARIHGACGLTPVIVRGKLDENEKEAKKAQKQRDPETRPLKKEQETKLEVTTNQAKPVDEKHQQEETANMVSTQLTHIIVDCSAMLYVDLMGKDALIEVYNDYKSIDIAVFFANTQERVRQLFESTDFFHEIPRNRVFVSVSDAVDQAELEQRRRADAQVEPVQVAPKPPVTEPPQAKSVGQKSVPVAENTLLATQSSASLFTGIDFSHKDKESTTKEDVGGAIHRRPRVPSKHSVHRGDDLDKTQ